MTPPSIAITIDSTATYTICVSPRQQIEDTERNLLAMSKQHSLTPQGTFITAHHQAVN